MKTTAMNPHYDSVAAYAKLGWVPFDKENDRSRRRSNMPTTIIASHRWPRRWAKRTTSTTSCIGRATIGTSSTRRSG